MNASSDDQGGQSTIILGMGNPLLDMQMLAADISLYKKYGIAEDGAELVNDGNRGRFMPLFGEIENSNAVQYVPGGSAQNTMRVFQWMIRAFGGKEKSAAYFGAVGCDKNAELLQKLASEAGMNVRYQCFPERKTGVCAVLVHDTKRSLVAHLGAAEHFTTKHLEEPENLALIESAECYYVEGYFLTVCPEAILKLAERAAQRDKPFSINLSAEYICEFYRDRLNAVLPYVDILFGNESEARAYARGEGLVDSETMTVEAIAQHLAALEKLNNKRDRCVIITRGSNPIIVARGPDGSVHDYPIQPIAPEHIKDTNAAGDAFSGGFLAAFTSGCPLDKCIQAGNFAAHTVIQHIGCTFPSDCSYVAE